MYFVAIDLNDLKQMNDRYGHAEGDALLQSFSRLLLAEFGRDGTLVRIGGDEFLLLLGGLSREALDARIRRVHEQADLVYTQDIPLSFCEGVFQMNEEGFSFDKGMKGAEMDLLRSKGTLENRV